MAKRFLTLFLLVLVYSVFSNAYAYPPTIAAILQSLQQKAELNQQQQIDVIQSLTQLRSDPTSDHLTAYFEILLGTSRCRNSGSLYNNQSFLAELDQGEKLIALSPDIFQEQFDRLSSTDLSLLATRLLDANRINLLDYIVQSKKITEIAKKTLAFELGRKSQSFNLFRTRRLLLDLLNNSDEITHQSIYEGAMGGAATVGGLEFVRFIYSNNRDHSDIKLVGLIAAVKAANEPIVKFLSTRSPSYVVLAALKLAIDKADILEKEKYWTIASYLALRPVLDKHDLEEAYKKIDLTQLSLSVPRNIKFLLDTKSENIAALKTEIHDPEITEDFIKAAISSAYETKESEILVLCLGFKSPAIQDYIATLFHKTRDEIHNLYRLNIEDYRESKKQIQTILNDKPTFVSNYEVVKRWNTAYPKYKIRTIEDLYSQLRSLSNDRPSFKAMTPPEALEILVDQWDFLHGYFKNSENLEESKPLDLSKVWKKYSRKQENLLSKYSAIVQLNLNAGLDLEKNKSQAIGRDFMSDITLTENPYKKLLLQYSLNGTTAVKNSFIPDFDKDTMFKILHRAQVWLVEHSLVTPDRLTAVYINAIKVGDINFIKKYNDDPRIDAEKIKDVLKNSLTDNDIILSKVENNKALSENYSNPYEEILELVSHFIGIDTQFIQELYVETLNPNLVNDERLDETVFESAYFRAIDGNSKNPLVVQFEMRDILNPERYRALYDRAVRNLIVSDLDALQNNPAIDLTTRQNAILTVAKSFADAFKKNDLATVASAQLILERFFSDFKDELISPTPEDHQVLWDAIAQSVEPDMYARLRDIFRTDFAAIVAPIDAFHGKTVGELRHIITRRDPQIMSKIMGSKNLPTKDSDPVTPEMIQTVFLYAIQTHNTNLLNQVRYHPAIDVETYNDGYVNALEDGSGDMVYELRDSRRVSNQNRFETLITLMSNREMMARVLWADHFGDSPEVDDQTKKNYMNRLKEKVYANSLRINPTDTYVQTFINLIGSYAIDFVQKNIMLNDEFATAKYVQAVRKGDYKTVEKFANDRRVDVRVVQNILSKSHEADDVIMTDVSKNQLLDSRYNDRYNLVFDRVSKFSELTDEFLQSLYLRTLNPNLRDDPRIPIEILQQAYDQAFETTDKPIAILFRGSSMLTNTEAFRLFQRAISKMIPQDLEELSRYLAFPRQMIRKALDEIASVYSTTSDEKIKEKAETMISELSWKYGQTGVLPNAKHTEEMWNVLKIKYGPHVYARLQELFKSPASVTGKGSTFEGKTVGDLKKVFVPTPSDLTKITGSGIFGFRSNSSQTSDDDIRKAFSYACEIGDLGAVEALQHHLSISTQDFSDAYATALKHNQVEVVLDLQSDTRLSDENKFQTVRKLLNDQQFVSDMSVYTNSSGLSNQVDPELAAMDFEHIGTSESAYAKFLIDAFALCDRHSPGYFTSLVNHAETDDGLIHILDIVTAHAIARQRYDILQAVLTNPKITDRIVNSLNNRHKSNLFIATVFGDQEVIKLYLQHPQIDVNIFNGLTNPRTLLETALLNNNSLSYELYSIVRFSNIYEQLSGSVRWVDVFNRNNLVYVDGKPPMNWHDSKEKKGSEGQNRANRDKIAEMFWFHSKTNLFSKASISPTTQENIITDLDLATAARLYDKFSATIQQTNGVSFSWKEAGDFANHILAQTFNHGGKGETPIYKKTPDERVIRGFLYSASGPNRNDFGHYLKDYQFDKSTVQDALAIFLLTPVAKNKVIRQKMFQDFLSSGSISKEIVNERFVSILNELIKRPDQMSPDVLNARVRAIIGTDKFAFTMWSVLLPQLINDGGIASGTILNDDNLFRLTFILDAKDQYVNEINDQLWDESSRQHHPINATIKLLALNEAIKLKQVQAVKAIRKSLDNSKDRTFAKAVRRKYVELALYYSKNPLLLKTTNIEIMNLLSYAITDEDLERIRDQVFPFLRETLAPNVAAMITGHITKQKSNSLSYKYRANGDDLSFEMSQLRNITNVLKDHQPPIELPSQYLKAWTSVTSIDPIDVTMFLSDLGDSWVDLLKMRATKENAAKIYQEYLEDLIIRAKSKNKSSEIYTKKITFEDIQKQLSTFGLGTVAVLESAMDILSITHHQIVEDLYDAQKAQMVTQGNQFDFGLMDLIGKTVYEIKERVATFAFAKIGGQIISNAIKKDPLRYPKGVTKNPRNRDSKSKSLDAKLSATPKIIKEFAEAVNNRKTTDVRRLVKKYAFDQSSLGDAFVNLLSRQTSEKNRLEILKIVVESSGISAESINQAYESEFLRDVDGIVTSTIPVFVAKLTEANAQNADYLKKAKLGDVSIAISLLRDETITDSMKLQIVEILLYHIESNRLLASQELSKLSKFYADHSEQFLHNAENKFALALDFVKSAKILAEKSDAFKVLVIHDDIDKNIKPINQLHEEHNKEFNIIQAARKIYEEGYESEEVIAHILAYRDQLSVLKKLGVSDKDPRYVKIASKISQTQQLYLEQHGDLTFQQETTLEEIHRKNLDRLRQQQLEENRQKFLSKFVDVLKGNEPIEFRALLHSVPLELKLDRLFQGRLIFATTLHSIEQREYENLRVLLSDPDLDPNHMDEHQVTGLALSAVSKDENAIQIFLTNRHTDPNLQSDGEFYGFTALEGALYHVGHVKSLAMQFGLDFEQIEVNRTNGKMESVAKLLWNDQRTTAVTHAVALGRNKELKDENLISQFKSTLDINHVSSYELPHIFSNDENALNVVEVFKRMLGLGESTIYVNEDFERAITQKDQAKVHLLVTKLTPQQLSYEVGRAVFIGDAFYLEELLRNPYVDVNMIKYAIIYVKCNPPSYILTDGIYVKRDSNQALLTILIPSLPREIQDDFMKSTMVTSLENAGTVEQYRKVLHQLYPKNLIHDVSYNYIHATYYLDYLINHKIADDKVILPMIVYFEEVHHMAPIANVGNWNEIFPRMIELKGTILARHVLDEINTRPEKYPELQKMFADLTTEQTEQLLDLYSSDKNEIKKLNHLEAVLKNADKETVLHEYFRSPINNNETTSGGKKEQREYRNANGLKAPTVKEMIDGTTVTGSQPKIETNVSSNAQINKPSQPATGIEKKVASLSFLDQVFHQVVDQGKSVDDNEIGQLRDQIQDLEQVTQSQIIQLARISRAKTVQEAQAKYIAQDVMNLLNKFGETASYAQVQQVLTKLPKGYVHAEQRAGDPRAHGISVQNHEVVISSYKVAEMIYSQAPVEGMTIETINQQLQTITETAEQKTARLQQTQKTVEEKTREKNHENKFEEGKL